MNARTTATLSDLPGSRLDAARMPGHWLLARMGKRVLRPGGRRATRWLIEQCAIGPEDDVVEFAPGLGSTAALLLEHRPHSYSAVERDPAAARIVADVVQEHAAAAVSSRVVAANATGVPLEDESASIVIGEAMLSMQPEEAKHRIVAEAARLLRAGGRYAIHELALDDEHGPLAADIQSDMSRAIHVGVRIHSQAGWVTLLEQHGFQVEASLLGPMRLLEPRQLLRDEGVLGLARFCMRGLRDPEARNRIRTMRTVFRHHEPHLGFIVLVARRLPEWDLVETRLEERDGGTWVAGICSNCGQSMAVATVAGSEAPAASVCPSGHRVRVRELRSAGASGGSARDHGDDGELRRG